MLFTFPLPSALLLGGSDDGDFGTDDNDSEDTSAEEEEPNGLSLLWVVENALFHS
jgi:hypothetical protein